MDFAEGIGDEALCILLAEGMGLVVFGNEPLLHLGRRAGIG